MSLKAEPPIRPGTKDHVVAVVGRKALARGLVRLAGEEGHLIHDAKFFGIDMPDDVAMTVQDRAYTSPIWYTP